MESGNSVGRRKFLIIGLLCVVGIASLVLKVVFQKGYGLVNAFTDLGYEGLPAALLFVLIDGAIGRYEERQESRLKAFRTLKGEAEATALLNDLARGDHIQLGDLKATALERVQLKRRTVRDGNLDRSDLDGMSLTQCTLSSLSLRQTSLRVAVFESCTFNSIDLESADLTGALFADCDFDSATSFRDAILDDVRFTRCCFKGLRIQEIRPKGAYFLDCDGIDDAMRVLLTEAGATFISLGDGAT